MDVILLHSDHWVVAILYSCSHHPEGGHMSVRNMSVVTVLFNYIHNTKVHFLVSLINFIQTIKVFFIYQLMHNWIVLKQF
jgi:hypothetical protein